MPHFRSVTVDLEVAACQGFDWVSETVIPREAVGPSPHSCPEGLPGVFSEDELVDHPCRMMVFVIRRSHALTIVAVWPVLILIAFGALLPAWADGEETSAEKHGVQLTKPADPRPLSLSFDGDISLETGANLTFASVSSLTRLEARAFHTLEGRSATGVSIRLFRTILLDQPLAYWFVVLQHEAFGHGGRAREFGSSASFHLGSPWQGKRSYATFSTDGLSDEDLLRVYAGGSESNAWSATLLERELVAGRSMGPMEWLYLLRSRLVVSDYVLRTTPDPEKDPEGFYREWTGGGDVANYLGYLNTLHLGEPGITPSGSSPTVVAEYHRLRHQAYWNALDPGVWLSLWAVGRHVLNGDEPGRIPLPRLAGRRFLPVLSADWLPDGGVVSLEAIFGSKGGAGPKRGPSWFSFVLRRGRGPAGGFQAMGAAADRLWQTRKLQLGGEVEIWRQADHTLGGGVRLRLMKRNGRLKNLFLDAGVKSDGHWPGRPAGVGPFLRLGLNIHM